MSRDPYIALVGRIVRVIEALRDEPAGLTLRALASRTGYVPSSVHRLLHSLMRHGYVQQDRVGGPYRLGHGFLAFARATHAPTSLVQISRPYLRELLTAFNESAYLAVLRGDRGTFVEVQETTRDLRLVGPVGADVHYHATAAGKAMAAHFTAEQRDALAARLELRRITARTITSRTRLLREWAQIRKLGYAVNDEETIVGAVFLASPVFDAHGKVCGSVSVGVPKPRCSASVRRSIASRLKDVCARLSGELASVGYVPEAPRVDLARLAG
jgi:DNA-binding IclR family transcriptional regulator